MVPVDRGADEDDDDEWEDTDEEGDFDSEGGFSGDEEGGRGREFLFMDEETKSRFTEYSMTSSVMRRNEQLTLLDDRFEKVNTLFFFRHTLIFGTPSGEVLERNLNFLLSILGERCHVEKCLKSVSYFVFKYYIQIKTACCFSSTNSSTKMRSALWTTRSWKDSSSQTALVWRRLSKTTSYRKRRSECILVFCPLDLISTMFFLLINCCFK